MKQAAEMCGSGSEPALSEVEGTRTGRACAAGFVRQLSLSGSSLPR